MKNQKYDTGIILKADLGLYGNDPTPQLHLTVRDDNGWKSLHGFKGAKIIDLLQQFQSDYVSDSTINKLIHKEIILEKTEGTIKPKKIAANPTKKWIEGDI